MATLNFSCQRILVRLWLSYVCCINLYVNYQLTLVNNGPLIIEKQSLVRELSMCSAARVWMWIMSSGSEDLWRECASWLTRCSLLRPDHKANWPTSTTHDLAYTLRDGVLLCSLLNVLQPGCIDMKDVNQRPQMAQVWEANLRDLQYNYRPNVISMGDCVE